MRTDNSLPSAFPLDLFSQFQVYASDIVRAVERVSLNNIEVASSLGLSLTSYAIDRGVKFPFLVMPDFEVRASKILELSKTEGIVWSPFVKADDRGAWENYTVTEGPLWLRESLDASGMEDAQIPLVSTFLRNRTFEPLSGPALTGDETLSNMYAPIWYVFHFLFEALPLYEEILVDVL